jgi:Coenzyme PQQ synthesis protein D (PqqD)
MVYQNERAPAGREALLPKRLDLPGRPVSRDLMLRDPETGRVHFLNATAAVVWNCCDGETSVAECAQRLRSAFAVPPSVDLLADIRAAVTDLNRRGLLDE